MHGDQPGGAIHWRMIVPVEPQRVFDALNTNAGRAAFWAESAVESDGRIDFVFPNGHRQRCRVLERSSPDLFILQYFEGVARFDLVPLPGVGTDLLLTHEGVKNSWHEVHAGWLNVLFPLKAWLAHGVDLRNRSPRHTWNQGYADQ